MRRLAGVALAVMCGIAVRAEELGHGDSEIYASALHAAVGAEAKLYDSIGREMDSEILLVADEPSLREGLPTVSGRFRVFVMNGESLRDRYRREKKALRVWKLFRAHLDKGHLVVGINKYWFSYRKKLFGHPTYHWGLEGGVNVEYKYDCERRAWVLVDAKTWGI
jgi:hypothetical protein